ncbi:Gfo/Idh/MocA family oxidoreductase [Phragmitibacter flavus]|uniref:Gfo/Idh/MocA family oxidoreductase n=1 Tax=Phragmitibacter flavus TaxID=2576071 RepID=A0A5R8KE37_9BACT|nr:Gfo/Idh/MocA family oxidoreductase [Phragmitibacter flavus]TLD70553.1 Gfo/Idh/MocA family oxidoreductase [Phragmitibacter flavus]
MNIPASSPSSSSSRRDFLKTTTKTAAGLSVLSGITLPHVHAAVDDTVRMALIGCGGRGGGAASNALSVNGAPTRLVAMADVQPNRLNAAHDALSKKHPDKMSVSEDAKFIGFDAYKKAVDVLKPGDIAMFATPPAFRWVHYQYAIERGINIFMEKPLSVDGPTSKRMLELNELAKKKGLKVAVGLMCRHCKVRKDLYNRVQDGEIGDIVLARAYRMQAPVASCFSKRRPPETPELIWQIQRFHSFLWASGGAYSDFFIHNIDEACWMKNDWPVEAQASGGRTDRGEFVDQNFDHYSVEYTWKDGSKFFFEGRNITGCRNEFSTHIHGTKGNAIVSNAGHLPARSAIFKGLGRKVEDRVWSAPQPEPNPYQLEWDDFLAAIRNNEDYNEMERGVKASLVTCMGRMAAHTGQIITYDQMLNCPHEFAPGADKFTLDGPAPIRENAEGRYPVPIPGKLRDREYADAV